MGDKVIYSTDPAFCAACGASPCRCASPETKRRQPEPLRLSFQRGAKGSGVTRVERLNMHPTLKQEMLSRYKKRLGCGGAIKDGDLEFQGDHRDAVEAALLAEGYKVRRIG